MSDSIRVLIVEDEPAIADLMTMHLETHDMLCRHVTNAHDAVAAVEQDAPDVILMDMTIPRRPGETEHSDGGLWAVGQIRGGRAGAGIPIIAVSGHTEVVRVQAFRTAGCNDVISKPPDYDLVTERIFHHTARRPVAAGRVETNSAAEPTRLPSASHSETEGNRWTSWENARTNHRGDRASDADRQSSCDGPPPAEGFAAESSPVTQQPQPNCPVEAPDACSPITGTFHRLVLHERREMLRAESQGYRESLENLEAALVKVINLSTRVSPGEHGGDDWEHDLRNAVATATARLGKIRRIEEEALFDGFDPQMESLDRELRQVIADIPRRPPSEWPRPAEQTARPSKLAITEVAEPATILVADDEPDLREELVAMLAGHRVIQARDGHEVFRITNSEDVDLAILDLEMPGLGGLDVLCRMKGHERLRHIPVLMVSGKGDGSEILENALRAGAEDYLRKPIREELLRMRVKNCLDRERLRRQEYERFFSPSIARLIRTDPKRLEPRGNVQVSVLFCDIRGFSRITERLGNPASVLRWQNDVMQELSECVFAEDGTVVDYVGDEIMAMWGAPEPTRDHAQRACAAARAMVARLPAMNEKWQHFLEGEFTFGIGINSGQVMVGNVGSAKKFKYGPLGNAVNLASRIQGATKYTRTQVLISEATRNQLDDSFSVRRLGKVRTVNIREPVDLYEMSLDGTMDERFCCYEDALQCFEENRTEDAIARLGQIAARWPDDGPSLALLARAVQHHFNGERGDPVWDLPGK